MLHSEQLHPLDPGEGSKIFIAAGVIKHPSQLAQFLPMAEVDPLTVPAITVGSKVTSEWAGNAGLNGGEDFAYIPDLKMAGNCRGLPDEGVGNLNEFRKPVAELRKRGARIIFSVTNLAHERPIDVIPELVEKVVEVVNPTAVEVNLSCPNGRTADGSGFHPPLCNDADASGEVMAECRVRAGDETTLGAKDSAHVDRLESLPNEREIIPLAIAVSPYSDFITGINAIGDQPFPELTAGKGRGGVSGPIVAEISRSWLQLWRKVLPGRVALLSCGGIEAQNLAHEYQLRTDENHGAMLIGGAQQFYRARSQAELAIRWALETPA